MFYFFRFLCYSFCNLAFINLASPKVFLPVRCEPHWHCEHSEISSYFKKTKRWGFPIKALGNDDLQSKYFAWIFVEICPAEQMVFAKIFVEILISFFLFRKKWFFQTRYSREPRPQGAAIRSLKKIKIYQKASQKRT